MSDNFDLTLHCFSGVFHYASECFEGAKAFMGVDGKVRFFRPEENAHRMMRSAAYLDMPAPSEKMFVDMCIQCIQANWEHIPPYESGASLYIRPVLFGNNPQLGINSSKDVMFVVMCSGVGTYSGAEILSTGTAVISRNYDRAASFGSGAYKLGANYAQSLHAYNLAHGQGYRELLFLDTATHTHIEEFGSSNFFAIKGDTYITPDSSSILPSITNASLRTVVESFGMKVEMRKVMVEELSTFDEAGSCGTAVVITPLSRIDDKPTLEGKEITRSFHFGEKCGLVSLKLYNRIIGIQRGLEEDTWNWCRIIDKP